MGVALDEKKKVENSMNSISRGVAYVGGLTDGLKKILGRFVSIMKEEGAGRTDNSTVAEALVKAVRETVDWKVLEASGRKEDVETKLQAFIELAGASASPIGFAFDSDGTITAGRGAPIDPEMAAILSEVMSLTAGRISVITGKLRDDLRQCYIPDDLCLIARESAVVLRERSRVVTEMYSGTHEERLIEGVSKAFMARPAKTDGQTRTVYYPQRMEISEAEKGFLERLKSSSNVRFVPYSEESMDRITAGGNTAVIMFSSAIRDMRKASDSDTSAGTLLKGLKILPVDDAGAAKQDRIMLKNGLELLAIGVLLADVEQGGTADDDARLRVLLDAMIAITGDSTLTLADIANLVRTVSGEIGPRIDILLNRLLISVPMERANVRGLNALRAIYWAA